MSSNLYQIMNYDVFIPVRLSNTRLPQKAIKIVDGKPIILYLIERLMSAKKIRNIVVCTTTMESDNLLVKLLEESNISVFRGSEKDILKRYLDAARKFGTDFIVSVDGDDVYTDPIYVDKIIEEYEETKTDFITGDGFPHGFVPVGITKNALEKICKLKVSDNTATGYREFFTQTNLFNCSYIKPKKHIKFPENLRLTLDYEEDFMLAKEIFGALGNNFHLEEIIALFEKRPDLIKIIEGVEKRWEKYFGNNLTDLTLKSTEPRK